MAKAFVYLDESGDLGWKLTGGSTKFLTIGGILCPESLIKHPRRVMRDLYTDRGWNTKKEKKWTGMRPEPKLDYAKRAAKLSRDYRGIEYFAMTVNKSNVRQHIRDDSNKLYNYMVKLVLVQRLARFDEVTLVPDERTIKVASGNSLHDYLQTELWFEEKVATKLTTKQGDSSKELNLQFADMLVGAVHDGIKDRTANHWAELQGETISRRLFF